MAFEIIGTGRAVPPRRVTNDELAKEKGLDTSDEWIRSHTGIGSRHIADENTASSDLALEAAGQALAMAEPGKSLEEAALSLDMIVVATATPDFFGSPATACVVQDKLGAKKAGAMDVTAGCTGFIYALETASGLLSLGRRKRVLVIGSDILTKFTNWADRGSCVLFGDGAGAVVLESTAAPSTGSGRRGVIRTILRADGSGTEHLYFRGGGSRAPFKEGEILENSIHIVLNGQAVYNFAVKAMTDTIRDILDQEGFTIGDVSLIIPHQANARIVQAAAKRLKIPEEKCFLNIEEYANTSAASIPIALDELNRGGKLHSGDLLLTVGFGAGLTYGANLVIW
ncbi:MAG: ketoacyl-ACP synthase III [Treponema sp.]|jgi:3-oxoacyl-[acyl-carrier-protein] synthase-3|nr:ketoacyl-ACP synthase III [Treponema sp.]